MGRESFLSSLPLSSFLPTESRKNYPKLLYVFSRAHSFLCSLSYCRGDAHFKTKTHVRPPKVALEDLFRVDLGPLSKQPIPGIRQPGGDPFMTRFGQMVVVLQVIAGHDLLRGSLAEKKG